MLARSPSKGPSAVAQLAAKWQKRGWIQGSSGTWVPTELLDLGKKLLRWSPKRRKKAKAQPKPKQAKQNIYKDAHLGLASTLAKKLLARKLWEIKKAQRDAERANSAL